MACHGVKTLHARHGCCGRIVESSDFKHDAGWSSPVAREAHNLEVVGSNPAPATPSPSGRLRSEGLFIGLDAATFFKLGDDRLSL